MSHAVSLERNPMKSNEVMVDTIAKETATSVDVVKAMYDEQIAALNAQATIKQFIVVIAMRRVRQQLRQVGNA
jgi:Protein of unknown function (DUF3562)